MKADMDDSLNVLGETLKPCSTDPVTGFFRDGCCNTGPMDHGSTFPNLWEMTFLPHVQSSDLMAYLRGIAGAFVRIAGRRPMQMALRPMWFWKARTSTRLKPFLLKSYGPKLLI